MKCTFSILSVLILLAACSGTAEDESHAANPVALVKVAQASTGDVAQTVSLYGEIERGDSQIRLVAPIEAIVVAIEAPAGTAVVAGQVIARLRASPASQAQLQAASADSVAASAALARANRLRSDGLASDAEVEAARSRATAASSLLASLSARADTLVLRAPQAGYVDSTGVGVGELAAPGAVVATLARTGKMKARFGIDPALARHLSAGAPISISAGDGAPPVETRITSISPVADAQTRLASVVATIPAQQGLAAGLPLSARVATHTSRATVTVPYAALLDDGGQPFVFVVKDGVARRKDVTVSASDASRAAILEGVVSGDPVIIEGATGVEDGMKVRTR